MNKTIIQLFRNLIKLDITLRFVASPYKCIYILQTEKCKTAINKIIYFTYVYHFVSFSHIN